MAGLIFVLNLVAALGCGLVAGVFFAFSAFIMRALDRQPTAQAVAAMQAINVTVLNAWFLGLFFGTALACVALAVLVAVDTGALALPVVGAALYVIGTFGVTVACNVPRNEALKRIDPGSGEAAAAWRRYTAEWTLWNHARTVAALAAAAVLTLALA